MSVAELPTETLTCTCQMAGWCERRNAKVHRIHWEKCQAGKVRHVDDFYSQPVSPQVSKTIVKPKREVPPDVCTIGTQIKDALELAIGQKIGCGSCKAYLQSLNRTEQHDHTEIVKRITAELPVPITIRRANHGQDKLRRWVSRVIAPIVAAPPAITYPIPFITQVQAAVRVAPRIVPRWHETVGSIERAGFGRPLLFCEPGTDAPADTEWTIRLGAVGSFKGMCERLVSGSSEWLLLCEDDVLLSSHTADYLRTMDVTNEVLSLYTCSKRQPPQNGFASSRKPLVGSLALLMRRSILANLMQSQTWRTWSRHDCVDQLLHRACRECDIPLMLHRPSLAQHTGDTPAIYQDRKLTSIRVANDWTQGGCFAPPLVTLITPTGDRPEAFKLCEQWMARQTYTGPIQWIVVDDGWKETPCTAGQEHIRETPMPGVHTLPRNIRTALPHVRGDYLLIIEDDDFYAPEYISAMVGRLHRADLAGELGAKYYYIRHQRWRHNVNHEHHASLCRTGMTRAVFETLTACAQGNHPSIDLRLWRRWKGSRETWRDETGDQSLCVGIKGVSGRQSTGWRPSRNSRYDRDLQQLRKWVGDEAASIYGRFS